MSFHVPERYRATSRTQFGLYASDATYGNNGMFHFNLGGGTIRAIASDGGDWDHVSVSLANRVPSWEEMCRIKDLFWDAEDVVIQIHPKKSEYVNLAKHCLHLWRYQKADFPLPHPAMVGPKSGQTQEQAVREYDKAVTA